MFIVFVVSTIGLYVYIYIRADIVSRRPYLEIKSSPVTVHQDHQHPASSSTRPDTRTRTRRQFDGMERQWHGVYRKDFKLYAYSAFFDNRTLKSGFPNPKAPRIVIVGVWDRRKSSLYCGFYNDSSLLYVSETRLLFSTISMFGSALKYAFVIQCQATKGLASYVSLEANETRLYEKDAFKIPVEIPPRPKEMGEFLICIKEAYELHGSTMDPVEVTQLIEWVELNKLLGVDHIVVYNHSITSKIGDVFRYYQDQGYMDIMQAGKLPSEKHPIKPARAVGINDCLYRNMYSYRQIINIDMDEIIASPNATSYHELLDYLSSNSRYSRNHTIYLFHNQRYFLDAPQPSRDDHVAASRDFLMTQYAVMHVRPESIGKRAKVIVAPSLCLMLSPHACLRRVSGSFVMRVKPNLAVSYHYKSCRKSRRVNRPKNCSREFSTAVLDDSMTRFGAPLETNVKRILLDMQDFV